jgi:hypothetical protein
VLGIRTMCQSSSFWLHSHAKVMNHHFIQMPSSLMFNSDLNSATHIAIQH